MKVRLGDVLRECKRRGISFADDKAAIKKVYEGLHRTIQSIDNEKKKLHKFSNEAWDVTKQDSKLGNWIEDNLTEAEVLIDKTLGILSKTRFDLLKYINK